MIPKNPSKSKPSPTLRFMILGGGSSFLKVEVSTNQEVQKQGVREQENGGEQANKNCIGPGELVHRLLSKAQKVADDTG